MKNYVLVIVESNDRGVKVQTPKIFDDLESAQKEMKKEFDDYSEYYGEYNGELDELDFYIESDSNFDNYAKGEIFAPIYL